MAPFAAPTHPQSAITTRATAQEPIRSDSFTGILQADAYSGYDALYTAGRKPGPILKAACWAHARRPFFKEARLSRTPLAVDVVTRMDAIFAAERVIWGRNASERLAARQVYIAPLVADLEQFLRQQYGRLSCKGDLAKAINYMLSRWASFARFVSDSRICMTNNAAERRVRTAAVGRRNWTFCGSDRGGDRAAAMYTLIQTCRLNGVDPPPDSATSLRRSPTTRRHDFTSYCRGNGKFGSSAPKPSRKPRSISRAKLESAHRMRTDKSI